MKVRVTYKNDRVVCVDEEGSEVAVLEISTKELKRMYFGKAGAGELTILKK